MNYNVIAIPKFRRDIKRMVKKFPSLKNEYGQLIETLKQVPTTAPPWGMIVIKYVSPLLLKVRVSLVAPGTLPISI